MYGISLHRMSIVPGLGCDHTMGDILATSEPFMYSMPGARAQLFFPDHWRAFMQFYYTRRDNAQAKPLLCITSYHMT